MNIRDYKNCSTAGLKKLDQQLINQVMRIAPNLLVRIDQMAGVKLGQACHPYLQAPAAQALSTAIAQRGGELILNSCYRTIAQQAVLFGHYQNNCACGIRAAARPGASNHNTALSLDIEDAQGWKPYLEMHGWDWIGSFDPMHFDFEGAGCKDMRWISIKAFQQLWNYNHPKQKIAEDGVWGTKTYQCLVATSCEGFARVPGNISPIAISPLATKATAIASLRVGSHGANVLLLQQALNRAGYPVKADGYFGAESETAVKAYQARFGLVADGAVGTATKQALGLA